MSIKKGGNLLLKNIQFSQFVIKIPTQMVYIITSTLTSDHYNVLNQIDRNFIKTKSSIIILEVHNDNDIEYFNSIFDADCRKLSTYYST